MKEFTITYTQIAKGKSLEDTCKVSLYAEDGDDAIARFNVYYSTSTTKIKSVSLKCNNVFDSSKDTLLHIKRVNELLTDAATELLRRGKIHDNSKLMSPEKELFDDMTPKLANSTYGSDEYKQFLSDLKPALDNHYKNNSHHPEHYEKGIDDMDLFDVIEMFCDWRAATERHKDGDIFKSIEINKTRFKMSDQLVSIFKNTAIKSEYKEALTKEYE